MNSYLALLLVGIAAASPIAAATLDPKLGANVALGADPPVLPANLRAQAEPHLVRSFTDTNLLVATFQEGRYTDGGALNCGYAVSTNGGLTWQRDLIPHLIGSIDGGPFARASDPVAGVDLQGHLYLNVIGIDFKPALWSTIVLSKSTNGGLSFDPPLTVLTNRNPDLFLDKNWMAINTFPGTPTAGRVVVTYTRFDDRQGINPIDALYSDDGGVTWTTPRSLSPPVCQGSQPLFLPDGSLAVVYWNFAGSGGEQIEVAYSADGGATFDVPRRVASVSRYADPVARSGAFLPTATTDRQLGVLYVAYQALSAGPKVLFTRSRDRGLTWTPPRAVNDTPNGKSVFNPAIAVSPDGQHVSVVFYDKRNDTVGKGNLVDLYLAESFDGGETWLPNLRLSGFSSDLQLAPLTASGRMVGDYQAIVPALNFEAPAFAIWIDTRTGSPDPFAISIQRTQGSRFSAWRPLAFSATELSNVNLSGESADPDHDGRPNLMEYGRGSDPHRSDRPDLTLTASHTGSRQEVAVGYETSIVAEDLRWGWVASLDLRNWPVAIPDVEQFSVGSTPDRVRRTSNFSADQDGRRFFRPTVQRQ